MSNDPMTAQSRPKFQATPDDDDLVAIIECVRAVERVQDLVQTLGIRPSKAFLRHVHDSTYLVAVTADFRESVEVYQRELSELEVPALIEVCWDALVHALGTTGMTLEKQENGLRALDRDQLNEGAELLNQATEEMRQYGANRIALDQIGVLNRGFSGP
jgi:hypothetical protein